MGITYASYSEGRIHFKAMLDAAERGLPTTVRRGHAVAAVVDAERLRHELGRVCPRAQVVNEADGWSVFLTGVPVAADGSTFDEAMDEMVAALRSTPTIGKTICSMLPITGATGRWSNSFRSAMINGYGSGWLAPRRESMADANSSRPR